MTAPKIPETFMAAAHPRQPELDQLVRELRTLTRTTKVHTMHADIMWRVRRGDLVTLTVLLELWPLGEERMATYVRDLQLWGLITIDGETIHLSGEP